MGCATSAAIRKMVLGLFTEETTIHRIQCYQNMRAPDVDVHVCKEEMRSLDVREKIGSVAEKRGRI